MAKRFTDSNKWSDPWFCSLLDKDKLFWIYILDNCDHAGIWDVNFKLVKFHIKGFVYKPEVFDGRIFEVSKLKWHVPKFLDFQYGELNNNNRVHHSVLRTLEKEGASKPLASPLLGAKDKDKDKDKDKEGVVRGNHFERPTIETIRTYCQERKNAVDPQRFFDYYEANGWKVGKNPMRDWRAAVRTWEKNGFNSIQPSDDGVPASWKTPQPVRR